MLTKNANLMPLFLLQGHIQLTLTVLAMMTWSLLIYNWIDWKITWKIGDCWSCWVPTTDCTKVATGDCRVAGLFGADTLNICESDLTNPLPYLLIAMRNHCGNQSGNSITGRCFILFAEAASAWYYELILYYRVPLLSLLSLLWRGQVQTILLWLGDRTTELCPFQPTYPKLILSAN